MDQSETPIVTLSVALWYFRQTNQIATLSVTLRVIVSVALLYFRRMSFKNLPVYSTKVQTSV